MTTCIVHMQRGGYRGHRGGRGGGRGRFRQQPLPPAAVDHAATDAETDNAQSTDLTSQAMEVVTALANVDVPVPGAMGEASDRSDSERASKWARKKERMLLLPLWREGPFHCGVRGRAV